MESISLLDCHRSEVVINLPRNARAEDLYAFVTLPQSDFYIACNGRTVEKDQYVQTGQLYRVVPRLLGGKGGFGSMLRALGAQIEKTTNREACRDLSGRRMRDVNNEKKLKDWIEKKAEREREREKRREERREKRLQFLQGPKHKFDDPDYDKQKMQVSEHLEEALQQGLQKSSMPRPSTSGTAVARKRKAQEPETATSSKKACEWLGIEDLSDLDTSSSSDSEDSAVPGPSSVASALPDVTPSSSLVQTHAHTAGGESDSGVESSAKSQTPGNSPMDVDSVESDDNAAKHGHSKEGEEKMQTGAGHDKPDLLSSLPPPSHTGADVDLMAFDHVGALEVLGLEGLKTALMARGMKCGGTLQQRAERLWAARGKAQHEIDPSLMATAAKNKGKGKGKKS